MCLHIEVRQGHIYKYGQGHIEHIYTRSKELSEDNDQVIQVSGGLELIS